MGKAPVTQNPHETPPRLQSEQLGGCSVEKNGPRERASLARGWLDAWMEQSPESGLGLCELHRNQHDELSQTSHTPRKSLGTGIPTDLGTPASSETGSGAIHPRGLEISIVTCHGAGPAPAAVANNPPLLWSILWSALGVRVLYLCTPCCCTVIPAL